jgi:hypothetical protein
LSNDDVVMVPGAGDSILNAASRHGACWASRWEFGAIRRPPTLSETLEGRVHIGRDLFAFTTEWWEKHGKEFPDMVFSSAQWDFVMAALMRETGGIELHGLLAHEVHPSPWFTKEHIEGPANRHNRDLSAAFHRKRGLPAP